MALYNRNAKQTTIKGLFSALPPQPTLTIEGENVHAGAAPTELMVRDVCMGGEGWKDLGRHSGSVSARLDAHATTVLLLLPNDNHTLHTASVLASCVISRKSVCHNDVCTCQKAVQLYNATAA